VIRRRNHWSPPLIMQAGFGTGSITRLNWVRFRIEEVFDFIWTCSIYKPVSARISSSAGPARDQLPPQSQSANTSTSDNRPRHLCHLTETWCQQRRAKCGITRRISRSQALSCMHASRCNSEDIQRPQRPGHAISRHTQQAGQRMAHNNHLQPCATQFLHQTMQFFKLLRFEICAHPNHRLPNRSNTHKAQNIAF